MAVEDLINDARAYSRTVLTDAQTALRSASDLVQSIGYVVPNFTDIPLPDTPIQNINLVPPTLQDVTLELPEEPDDAPVFQDISPIDPGVAPVLTATLPTITLPTKPNQVAEFLRLAPGINTDIVFPEPPDALINPLIEAPVLTDHAVPTKPEVLLPAFDVLAPQDNTVAPENLEATFRSAYEAAAPSTIAMLDGYVDAMLSKYNPRFHEQMERIEVQLARYMEGGTGFNPATENAIHERAKEKNHAEARRVRRDAMAKAADQGFTIPPGAAWQAQRQARQAAANLNAASGRDIVVLQSELEQKNLQFAVTTSASLRGMLLNATLSYHQNLININGQALDTAKAIVGALVESYNVAVRAYGVKVDAFKAEAMVYETRLKAALAQIELYRAEIQALEALTNVDRAKVDIYRARIDSLRALASVYEAQIQAVQGRASLEKLKLDVFQSEVQAYTAQVQGKNAEWQAYTAAIGGETAKAQLFRSQVEAFSAEVQGYKTGIEAKSEIVRAAALTNQARSQQYTAKLAGYTAVVNARGEKARTQLENQRQEVIAFQASAQAAIGNAQVQNEYYKSVSYVAVKNAEIRLTSQVQVATLTRAFGEAIARLGTDSAGIYGRLAGAAVSGMVSLAAETRAE